MRLLLLPSDPDLQDLEINDELWECLQERKTMPPGYGEIHVGDKVVPTAHAAAIIRDDSENPAWRSHTAVHRNNPSRPDWAVEAHGPRPQDAAEASAGSL